MGGEDSDDTYFDFGGESVSQPASQPASQSVKQLVIDRAHTHTCISKPNYASVVVCDFGSFELLLSAAVLGASDRDSFAIQVDK